MIRLRRDDGFTLPELLIAMSLMLVMLAAALTTLDQFTTNSNRNQELNVAQDTARTSIDLLTRQLRNLASPTQAQPQAVEKNGAQDIVFLSVDPVGPAGVSNGTNSRRMRYCLDSSTATNEKLYRQTQTWTTAAPPAVPSTASCPDPSAAWNGLKTVVANNVVNNVNGQARPVWIYNSSTLATISGIQTDLFLDTKPGKAPGETRLTSGVFLRNQNRPPAASFTAQATGNKHVLLNGSASTDPEGQVLTYVWYDGATKIGPAVSGVTLDYTSLTTGNHILQLKVFDPAGLEGDSATQTVNVL